MREKKSTFSDKRICSLYSCDVDHRARSRREYYHYRWCLYTTLHAVHIEIVLNGCGDEGMCTYIFARNIVCWKAIVNSKMFLVEKKQLFFSRVRVKYQKSERPFRHNTNQTYRVHTSVPRITFMRAIRSANIWNTWRWTWNKKNRRRRKALRIFLMLERNPLNVNFIE